jgi:hypothetical protein
MEKKGVEEMEQEEAEGNMMSESLYHIDIH